MVGDATGLDEDVDVGVEGVECHVLHHPRVQVPGRDPLDAHALDCFQDGSELGIRDFETHGVQPFGWRPEHNSRPNSGRQGPIYVIVISMGSEFLVYGLIDPRNGQLRYVGCCTAPLIDRVKEHLSNARNGLGTHKYNWIRQVIASGQELEYKILESFQTSTDMFVGEVFHISRLLSLGCNLTNATAGGEGFRGRHSEETKLKISLAKKGMRGSRIGAVLSDQTKAKISHALIGRRGHPQSARHTAKLSKPVIDENGIPYPSASAAARSLGCRPGNVCDVLQGRRKHYKGHVFHYL